MILGTNCYYWCIIIYSVSIRVYITNKIIKQFIRKIVVL